MKGLIFTFKADWSATYFWRDFPNIKAGAEIRLFDILTHKSSQLPLLKKAEGARKGYNIPNQIFIVLSTIMPDNNLDKLDIEKYIKCSKIINPDLLTSIEVSLSNGDKGYLVYKKIEEYQRQLIRLRDEFGCEKVIVLIPGRNNFEVEQCARFAYNLGFRKMGLACSDPMQRNCKMTISNIKNDLNILKKYADETYLFGLTSPRHVETFSYVDYIVSKGWYHKTMKFKEKLTHKGAVKVSIPIINGKQQRIISDDGKICFANENFLKERRLFLKRGYCLNNILVLLLKFDKIKSQTKLGGFIRCQVKEHQLEQAIAK